MTIVSMPSRAASASGSWLDSAAVDSNQQCRAASRERADRVHVRPIPLEQTVRDVDDRIYPGAAQEPRERRRRGRAIDVRNRRRRDRLATHRPRPRSAPPRSMPSSVLGSGIACARRVEVAPNLVRSRPAGRSTRASRSGRSCRCAIASARAEPRSSNGRARGGQWRMLDARNGGRSQRRQRGTGQDGQHRSAL